VNRVPQGDIAFGSDPVLQDGALDRSKAMIPDFSFVLLFKPSARNGVFEALKPLCFEDVAGDLELAKTKSGKCEVHLSFRAPADVPETITEGLPRHKDGSIVLGLIYLHFRPTSSWLAFPDCVEFSLWPCCRQLQRACMGSRMLRHDLVRILEEHDGKAGLIDDGSGAATEFWIKGEGRMNDDYPFGIGA
jgi:hypothetical protein